MALKKKHKVLRIVLVALLVLLLAGAGFAIWFSRHYVGILRKNIPVWVYNATDGVYRTSVQDIYINLLTHRVTVTGIRLQADTNRINELKAYGQAPATFFDITIPRVQVWGLLWEDMVTNKQLSCKTIKIWQPDVKVTYKQALADSSAKHDPATENDSTKSKAVEAMSAGQIIIAQPRLTYEHSDSTGTLKLHTTGGNIVLNDWKYDTEKPKDSSRFFYAKSALIDIDSIHYGKEHFLYDITTTLLHFNSDSNRLSFRHFALKPNVSKAEFYKIMGMQHDMFMLSLPAVTIDSLGWKGFINDKVLAATSVQLNDPVLEDYFTRLAPPNTQSKLGKYPNQLLENMKLKVDIRRIGIKNGHVQYTEVNEKTKLAGVLHFDGINGSVSNATNLPERITKNERCIIKLNGQFMKSSPISAIFNFSLTDPDGAFTVDGQLKDLDAAQINPVAKALAVTEIKSVHISKLDLHVSGNESHGNGTVTMLYHKLKVAPQNVDDPKKLSDKPLLSFLTNNLVIYTDNPMEGEPVRTESDYVPRDIHKSFFNLVWKCIFNPVQKTAVRSDNIEQTLEDKQNKKNATKGFFRRLFGGKKKSKK
ncbi:MAG: hypothetical protein BGO69_17820 [Bacteroidetes bacterium 46-16]|nr:MAG: hypothetical protein BGO69_17820 [Bacteroidetes bacterium 46-16]